MRLLVVDDEYYIVNHIVNSIHRDRLGLKQVYSAYSSEQAREIMGREEIDILLTDIEMPHGNGLELIEWASKHKKTKLVYILTGHQRFDYAHRAITMRCTGYILKPVEITLLENELLDGIKMLNDSNYEIQPGETYLDTDNSPDFVKDARTYIREHLHDPELSRHALADHVHMNPDYLSHLFHLRFHQTLNSYITNMRIDWAKEQLLSTRMTLQEISDSAGFSSYSYFCKQFKKTTGHSPQKYRELNGR